MFFFTKNLERGKKKGGEKKTDWPLFGKNSSRDRVWKAVSLLWHKNDIEKTERKTTLTCISEERKKTGWDGESVSYTPEYINTSSPSQRPLILVHKFINKLSDHILYLYEAHTSNCTFSMLHISNRGVGGGSQCFGSIRIPVDGKTFRWCLCVTCMSNELCRLLEGSCRTGGGSGFTTTIPV